MALKAKKTSHAARAGKPAKPTRALRLQYGALPYRVGDGGAPEFLLVTTRQSKRWIIPKGGPIKGLKPAKSAAQEAFEEAGIRGAVGAKTLGSFTFDKSVTDVGLTIPCEVRVFPLLVKRQYKIYPEAEERTARWFDAEGALAALKDAGLQEIIEAFSARLAARKKPVKKRKVKSLNSPSLQRRKA